MPMFCYWNSTTQFLRTLWEHISRSKKSLDDEDSDYNPDNDDTETYNSNEDKNYNHNLDLDVVGVHPNNPINNHTEDEEKVDENIEYEK